MVHPPDRADPVAALSVVPIDSRCRLTDGLLGPLLADREWHTLRATLIAWADNAFNVTRAADRLQYAHLSP
jgi:carbohydrate diacid regulator